MPMGVPQPWGQRRPQAEDGEYNVGGEKMLPIIREWPQSVEGQLKQQIGWQDLKSCPGNYQK